MNIAELYNQKRFNDGVMGVERASGEFRIYKPELADELFKILKSRSNNNRIWSFEYNLLLSSGTYTDTASIRIVGNSIYQIVQMIDYLIAESVQDFCGDIDFDYDHCRMRFEYPNFTLEGTLSAVNP